MFVVGELGLLLIVVDEQVQRRLLVVDDLSGSGLADLL